MLIFSHHTAVFRSISGEMATVKLKDYFNSKKFNNIILFIMNLISASLRALRKSPRKHRY